MVLLRLATSKAGGSVVMAKFCLGLMLMVINCFNTSYAANIVVFGDSISAAYGIEVNKGWVAKFQQKLKQHKKPYQVINASVSGETTSGGLSRLHQV